VNRFSKILILLLGIQVFWNSNLNAFTPYGTEWKKSRTNPVEYYINLTNAPVGFQQAVVNAFNSWNNVTAADIYFIYAGTTNVFGLSQDNINTISWSSIDPFPGSPQTLARTQLISTGDSIIEVDILFDGTENYSTSGSSGTIDIQTVALHEIGHFVGLDHSAVTPSIMLPVYNELQRNLYQDDKDGISFIYDKTAPTLQIKNDIGNQIAPNGFTNHTTIVATAQDTARGMKQIAIVQLPSGTTIQFHNFTGETSTVTATFSSLTDGQYKVIALDQRNNSVAMPFTIDTTPPAVTITNPSENPAYINSETFNIVWVSTDGVLGSGIEKQICNLYYYSYNYWYNWQLGSEATSETLTLENHNWYNFIVQAYDKAGNVGSDSFSIYIDTDPDGGTPLPPPPPPPPSGPLQPGPPPRRPSNSNDKTPPVITGYPTGNIGKSSYLELSMYGCCEEITKTKDAIKVTFGASISDNWSGIAENSVTGNGPSSGQSIFSWISECGSSGEMKNDHETVAMKYSSSSANSGTIEGSAYLHGSEGEEGSEYLLTVSAADKMGNVAISTWSFKVGLNSYISPTIANPGCDAMDDFEGVKSNGGVSFSPKQAEMSMEEGSIGIMATGMLVHNVRLLTTLVDRFRIVNGASDFTQLLPNTKVLVIPSGGLCGLGDVKSFKQKLQDYVNVGGTIIVFSQQHGYDFSALPVNRDASTPLSMTPLSAYGWSEDQSCHSNSTYINEVSPIFNGQNRVNLDCNVDGYFTQWPNNAKVLLNRTKNNMPCMLEYEILRSTQNDGNTSTPLSTGGRVIVTTLYSDFSYAQGSLSSEEKTLIKNLITYCKDSTTPATQQLRITHPIEGITFSVQSPSDVLLVGQDVVFSIKINNTTNEDRTIRVEWDWTHRDKCC